MIAHARVRIAWCAAGDWYHLVAVAVRPVRIAGCRLAYRVERRTVGFAAPAADPTGTRFADQAGIGITRGTIRQRVVRTADHWIAYIARAGVAVIAINRDPRSTHAGLASFVAVAVVGIRTRRFVRNWNVVTISGAGIANIVRTWVAVVATTICWTRCTVFAQTARAVATDVAAIGLTSLARLARATEAVPAVVALDAIRCARIRRLVRAGVVPLRVAAERIHSAHAFAA